MSGEISPPPQEQPRAASPLPVSTWAGAQRDVEPGTPRLLVPVARALVLVNRGMVVLGMVALLLAALVLTSSVLSRYFLHASTDWQDETAVFLLVGATFLAGAFVQSIRGHVGIEAVSSILPKRANAYRQVAIDLVCMAFCLLFAWKSWTLLRDAWVDSQTTNSTWGPPLWIPYFMMAFGMSLLALQLLLQFSASANRLRLRLENH